MALSFAVKSETFDICLYLGGARAVSHVTPTRKMQFFSFPSSSCPSVT